MSEHIPDLTKMISDTPRTDAAELEANIGVTHVDHKDLSAAYHFARQLERELDSANKRIKRLEAVINNPHALWANWLRGSVTLPVGIGDVRQYQDRIKCLEEAGDKLSDCADQIGWTSCESPQWIKRAENAVKDWHKAKEAKP